ncbi:hypothetical protein C2G38_2153743 [Gigaspora rosea]|uniref:Uncharacterized protein n=1 Tax=Gigaspora rosea TaxID=44941 RepID=A0A397W5K9_9GLOM|nr:hypothetical protein C2G38_2153743 [Gigaspora rosea]
MSNFNLEDLNVEELLKLEQETNRNKQEENTYNEYYLPSITVYVAINKYLKEKFEPEHPLRKEIEKFINSTTEEESNQREYLNIIWSIVNYIIPKHFGNRPYEQRVPTAKELLNGTYNHEKEYELAKSRYIQNREEEKTRTYYIKKIILLLETYKSEIVKELSILETPRLKEYYKTALISISVNQEILEERIKEISIQNLEGEIVDKITEILLYINNTKRTSEATETRVNGASPSEVRKETAVRLTTLYSQKKWCQNDIKWKKKIKTTTTKKTNKVNKSTNTAKKIQVLSQQATAKNDAKGLIETNTEGTLPQETQEPSWYDKTEQEFSALKDITNLQTTSMGTQMSTENELPVPGPSSATLTEAVAEDLIVEQKKLIEECSLSDKDLGLEPKPKQDISKRKPEKGKEPSSISPDRKWTSFFPKLKRGQLTYSTFSPRQILEQITIMH